MGWDDSATCDVDHSNLTFFLHFCCAMYRLEETFHAQCLSQTIPFKSTTNQGKTRRWRAKIVEDTVWGGFRRGGTLMRKFETKLGHNKRSQVRLSAYGLNTRVNSNFYLSRLEQKLTQIFVRVDSSTSLKHIIVTLSIQCTRDIEGLLKRSINNYIDKIDCFKFRST